MAQVVSGKAHSATRIQSEESLFEQLEELSEEAIDDLLFSRAHQEVRSNRTEAGPYARAFALADGDDAKANARYIELRVEGLNKKFHVWKETADTEYEVRRLKDEEAAQTTLTNVALFVIGLLLVILIF